MRIKRISATDIPPVETFIADDLKDLVVIAGPNGVGKTRLIDGILNYFRTFQPNMGGHLTNLSFIIEATDPSEGEIWGQQELDTTDPQHAATLTDFLRQNRRRRNFRNSVLYYESNRTIQQVTPFQFQFDLPDPWEEHVSWDFALGGLNHRWEDTQHAIFKKLESQRTSIGNRAIQLRNEGRDSMRLLFSDPMIPFNEAFSKLLGPKTFATPRIREQRLTYMDGENEFDIEYLSSGEREVLSIAFDFILRNPSHCIVFFDEPELHLHPELLYRLIMTLRSVGESNQFILLTHSAELISSSLDESVIFLTPPKEDQGNQAVKIEPTGDVAEALHQLGQSVGIVSLGKKIVLIEGSDSSLDKKTYGQIVKDKFPELVLLPSGGKENLSSFKTIASEVLDKSLWGIRFFMLADRDAATETQPTGSDNFRILTRYHLENYFLDAKILCQCFVDRENEDSWLLSVEKIEARLRKIAKDALGYSVSLVVSKKIREAAGNVSIMPKGSHAMDVSILADTFSKKAADERQRIANELDDDSVRKLVEDTYQKFEDLLAKPSDDWKNVFPGKLILSRFCHEAREEESRLKNLYIRKAQEADTNPFQEIIDIFSSFARA